MRYFTAGESHGPRLTAIIEGVPAGLSLSAEDINRQRCLLILNLNVVKAAMVVADG